MMTTYCYFILRIQAYLYNMKYIIKHKLFKYYLLTSKWDMIHGIETTTNKYEAEVIDKNNAQSIADIFNALDGRINWIIVDQKLD